MNQSINQLINKKGIRLGESLIIKKVKDGYISSI